MLAERLGAVLTRQELNAAFKEMLSYSAGKDKLMGYSADKVDFGGFSKWWVSMGTANHSDSMNHPTD